MPEMLCQQGCGQRCYCSRVHHRANRGVYHSICCWSEQSCTSLGSSLSPDNSNLITCKMHIFPHSQCVLHLQQLGESKAAIEVLQNDLAAMHQHLVPTLVQACIRLHFAIAYCNSGAVVICIQLPLLCRSHCSVCE